MSYILEVWYVKLMNNHAGFRRRLLNHIGAREVSINEFDIGILLRDDLGTIFATDI